MADDRLEEFLDESSLLGSEKRQIREASDKNKVYQEIIFWHELRDVRSAYREFHQYLEKNCLFMSPELRKAFSEIDSKMWDVLITREIGKEVNDFKQWVAASKKMREEIEPDLKAMEETVQKRLHGEVKA